MEQNDAKFGHFICFLRKGMVLFYINMSNALRLTSFDANIILTNQMEAARGIKTEQRFTFSHSVGGTSTSKFIVRQKCSDFTILQNGR